jgi:MFS family permease
MMIEFFFGLGAALLIPYFNIFFAEQFNANDQTLGTIFGLSSLFIGLGALLAPYLTKKLGTRIRAIVLTQGLSMVFLMVMGFSPWFALAVLGLWGRHAFMQLSIPLYDSFLMDFIEEKKQGTYLSLKYFCFQIGWAIGPYVSGIIQKDYGFSPLFIITSILYVISITATWVFFRNLEVKTISEPVYQPKTL